MKFLSSYVSLFLISGTIVALDQWTKWLVRTQIALGDMWVPGSLSWLMPYARIVNWSNTGTAFGLFQGLGGIFTVLALIVSGVIIYYYPRVPAEDWWLRLAMAFQLGGALGNLTDRVTRGQVTDFISVGRFPVWNVADASITIGVVILVVGVWWKERNEKRAAVSEP